MTEGLECGIRPALERLNGIRLLSFKLIGLMCCKMDLRLIGLGQGMGNAEMM
jgi:hypothetical protein